MDSVDEMVIKWSLDSSNFTKGLTSIDKNMKVVKSEFEATDSSLKVFGDSTDRLKAKQEYLNKTMTLQETKVKELKASYEKIKRETGENSDQTQKLAVQLNNSIKYYNNLQNQLKQTNTKLEDQKNEVKENGSAWEKFSKQAQKANENINDSLGKIKDGVLKISAAFSAITGVSASFADSYQQAMNKFQGATGVSKDELGAFEEVIKNVYSNNFGENFEDVANSVANVNKYLKLTGEGLQDATELAIGFKDQFGVETNESLRAVKALMDNFKISTEEAFNLLVQGEQNGLDYSGELIDNVNEYSVQFEKLGLTAGDMFNIFQSGADNGAFNLDKIGDAVKEFSVRAIDGSNTTIDGFTKLGFNADNMARKFGKGGDSAKEAFNQVINGIRNMKDPVAQSVVGVDLFGTMWEDLGPQVVTQLNTVTKGYDKTKESANQLNDIQYNSLSEGIKGLWRQVQVECLQPINTELMPQMQDLFTKLQDKMPLIKDFISEVITDISKSFSFLIDNFNVIKPIAITALTTILAFKTVNTVNNAVDSVTKSIDNLQKGYSLLTSFNGKALKGVKDFGGMCSSSAKNVLNFAKNIGTAAINLGKQSAQAGLATIKLAAHKTATLLSTAATKLMSLAQAALNFVLALNPITLVIVGIAALVGAITVLWNTSESFRNFVIGAFESIRQVFQSFDSWIVNVFSNDWSNRFGFFGEILNGFFANCSNVWSSIKSIFSGIIDFVSGVFTGNWSRAWEGVKDIFGGIFSGLGALIKFPLNSVIALVNGAIGEINRISIDIPDWMPSFGGKHFGTNIPKINYLYEGGIIDSPTLIGSNTIVGDSYKGMGRQAEAVIPLDSMYRNLRNIVKEESINQPIYVVVNVDNNMDNKAIGKAVTSVVKKEISRDMRNYTRAKGGI